MAQKQVLVFVGGTGGQGLAVINVLAAIGRYQILALTRDVTSSRAKQLAALPDVEVLPTIADTGYNEKAFAAAAVRADYVFVNTDGFSLGELAETYWGIRLFELSARAGIKHLIYSGLDSNGPKSNYDPDLYVMHYEAKARVQTWMHAQGKEFPMTWTIIRTGPYAETLSDTLRPALSEDGTVVFQLPLGDGEMPFVSLDDLGAAVDWAFSNPDESRGLDFGLAIEHAGLEKLAEAYRHATGKESRWVDVPTATFLEQAFGKLPNKAQTKIGFHHVKDDSLLTLTYERNFTNWFNLYKASKGNKGLITRDYAFLDKILPSRSKSIQEWMQRTGYTGEPKTIMKLPRR